MGATSRLPQKHAWPGAAAMSIPLACKNASVFYGAFQALSNVSIGFEAGQIHALLGQNGAGKTSLARFLSGLIQSAEGQLTINGTSVEPGDISSARALGLDIVHQRLSLPPTFKVADALELGATARKGGAVFSAGKVANAWQLEMSRAGIAVSPHARIGSLPIETVQSLENLRALAGNANVLILDEPTALLSPRAREDLFERLRQLRNSGVTLIVILHKLREVFEVSDTVSVLRQGRLVAGPLPVSDVTAADLSDFMIGGQGMSASTIGEQTAVDLGKPLLELKSVSTETGDGEIGLQNLSLQVGKGEIVGFAGIEGNGQRQLANALCGLTQVKAGQISMDGMELTRLDPMKRRKMGVRVVPFDRVSEGVSMESPLWENVTSWRAQDFRWKGFPMLSLHSMKRFSERSLNSLGVVFSRVAQPAWTLSGGNLQRLVLARELEQGARLVVAAHPTRGLDFSAAEFVLGFLRQLSRQGSAIVLISSDLDELFEVSDRLYVLYGGKLSKEFRWPYNRQSVGDAMVGTER